MKKLLRPAAIFLLVIAAGILIIPKPDLLQYRSASRAYFDRQGRLLRLTLADDERYRLPVPLQEIAPELREATLLYEDRDFYRHPGVDPLALLRAFWTSYILRERPVGASTITMQVARVRWRLQTRTLPGKFLQILRALQLTRHYSKDEIFAAYLNLAPYGRNIEGVEAASLIYFNKSAKDLTLPEALSLCVVPQNPVKRNPTIPGGFAALKAARDQLFRRWQESYPEAARLQPFFDLPLQVRIPEDLPFRAPHLVSGLDQQLPPAQRGRIATTIDGELQSLAERRLKDYVARHKNVGIVNGAVAILNHQTMEVEALVGSADFWNRTIDGQVDGCTAPRSPGSTLKPFVYGLAMDQGLIHPMTMLKDAPRRFAGFAPENYDQAFLGPMLARDALINSRNLPAAHLQAALRKPGLYELLQTAGVKNLREENYYGLALALGGVEVTMLDLLKLYAMLPNGGLLQPLRLLRHDPITTEGPSPLSPEACFLVLDILRHNPPPIRPALPGQQVSGPQVAWKTGTSHAFRDAWAVGVSGPYTVAVWIGNFDGSSNRAFVGRDAAGPLLFEVFHNLANGRPWRAADTLNPGLLNLQKVPMCADTGDLPGRYCPRTAESWFIPGVSPIKVSTVHRAVPIDKKTGLRACRPQPGTTEMQVYEFWPSDLQQIFRQAGLALKSPPPFAADCSLDLQSQSGAAPSIQSPVDNLEYRLRSEKLEKERIPFSAVADGDVRELFWFVDDRYVSSSKSDEPFFWPPVAGDYVVRVVDDHGRADHRRLRVGMMRDREN
ncbi:MAG: penicillin-binding protein 1C [Syntrophotaleaceae bacterium]